MEGGLLIKFELFKELKAIVIILFSICGFLFVREEYALFLLGLVSLFFLSLSLYIKNNNLIFAKQIYFMVIAFFNVTSLFFMIQCLLGRDMGKKIFSVVFRPFSQTGNLFLCAGWIFLLSMILIFLQVIGGGKSE